MSRRKPPAQESFAFPVASKKRPRRSEKPGFYEAVLFLRAKGIAVSRISPTESLIAGRIVENKWVPRFASEKGWSK